MSLRRKTLAITTDAAGAFTGYVGPVSGLLLGVYADNGSGGTALDAGTDITITEQETGAAILTITNLAADARYLPRQPVHDNAGAAIAGAYDAAPVSGQVKVVVAAGGNAKSGLLYLYWDDLGFAG